MVNDIFTMLKWFGAEKFSLVPFSIDLGASYQLHFNFFHIIADPLFAISFEDLIGFYKEHPLKRLHYGMELKFLLEMFSPSVKGSNSKL